MAKLRTVPKLKNGTRVGGGRAKTTPRTPTGLSPLRGIGTAQLRAIHAAGLRARFLDVKDLRPSRLSRPRGMLTKALTPVLVWALVLSWRVRFALWARGLCVTLSRLRDALGWARAVAARLLVPASGIPGSGT